VSVIGGATVPSDHVPIGTITIVTRSSGSSAARTGVLVEHWDVIQDEAAEEQSKSGQPMFGEKFGG
jgi:hypothetical protein